MATLSVQEMDFTGLAATYSNAAVGGDEFSNDGQTFIHIKNGATDVNVTIAAQDTSINKQGYGDVTIANTVVTCTASQDRLIGPFPQGRFNDSNGKVQLTYDDESNVTLAVVRMKASAK